MDTFGVLSVPTRLSVRDCLELWLHSSPRHAKMWTRRWCFWNGVSALLRLTPLCFWREKIQPSYLLYSKWLWPGQWNPCLCQLCPRPISRGSSPPVWTAASVWFPSFVSIWKIALHPVLWAVQQSERGAQTACNWLGSISNFCVTLSCSQAWGSWRGWLWCSAAAGEARVMWLRTCFWRGISLNPKGHPVCFLSSWMFCKSYEWWQRHTLQSSLLGVSWEFWLSKNWH